MYKRQTQGRSPQILGRLRQSLRVSVLVAICAALPVAATVSQAQDTAATSPELVVTLLGTGTPSADLRRAGFANLVQAGGTTLLFDAGRNVVTRLQQMDLAIGAVDAVFITHFHSDHVNGLDDILMSGYLTGPIGGRKGPLGLYGPPGVAALAEGIRTAHQGDITTRMADEGVDEAATHFDVHEAAPGVVFDADGVKVTMFPVNHGELIDPSVGYRVDYAGKSVTFSSDTKFDPAVIEAGRGTDLLVHSVGTAPDQMLDLPFVRRILNHHSSPQDVGRVFSEAAPKIGVLSHVVRLENPKFDRVRMSDIVTRVRETYDGPMIVAEDLMQFRIADNVSVLMADQ
ncbi:MBL fold metallo-hydrolase [Donghicola mangrovi]|uniref:MBL fold metallo-hydrolase n=1 Tax=Donghicola mangrovi TaxID=2729614 RepID=A0A850QB36_9RHOB|nr:MBL fold metallo-hydrolase [Donghicola mangrovi]NVO25552.1 MBL fold metallo-hydrolase [Donghicola mangrovi]